MRWKVCSVFMFAALVAASAYAGEKCTYDTQTCLNHMVGSAATKAWLGIEKEKTEGGVKVIGVTPGSPAAKAGFQVGDMLTAINGMSMGSDALKNSYVQINKVGSTNKYTVQRAGKSIDLQVTLEKMPDEVFTNMLGHHMLEHAAVQSAAK